MRKRRLRCSTCAIEGQPLIGKQCEVCAQAPYLTNDIERDDREKWKFNIADAALEAFNRRRVA